MGRIPTLVAVALLATIPATVFAQEPTESEPAGEAEASSPAEKGVETAPAKTEKDLTTDEKSAYNSHLADGKKAYASQDFAAAYTSLNSAYGILPKASILFNLALISEKGGELERARDHYQEYLQAPGVSLDNRKRASERLAAVQQILATSASAEEAKKKAQMTDLLPALEAMGVESIPETTSEISEPAEKKVTETKPTEVEPKEQQQVSTETPPEEAKYSWPVYAAYGTATAALAGGAVMVLMADKRIGEGKEAGLAGDNAGLASAEEDASLYATSAAGLFAGGAVLAVVGTYFLIKSNGGGEEPPKTESEAKPAAAVSLSLHKNFLGPVFSLKF